MDMEEIKFKEVTDASVKFINECIEAFNEAEQYAYVALDNNNAEDVFFYYGMMSALDFYATTLVLEWLKLAQDRFGKGDPYFIIAEKKFRSSFIGGISSLSYFDDKKGDFLTKMSNKNSIEWNMGKVNKITNSMSEALKRRLEELNLTDLFQGLLIR